MIINGGSTPDAISIYNPHQNTWSTPKSKSTQEDTKLALRRGYTGQTYLPNGKTFMIGGSWSLDDSVSDRDGEIFDPKTGEIKILPFIKAANIKMDVSYSCNPPRDVPECIIKGWQQHHPWLFAW